jgi:pullulanase/glycogen debranching enzyme
MHTAKITIISWLDWELLEKHKDFYRFVLKNIIAFRKTPSIIKAEALLSYP